MSNLWKLGLTGSRAGLTHHQIMETAPNATDCDNDTPRGLEDDVFSALIASHQDCLRRFVRCQLPGDPDADDVVQRANMVLWRRRQVFEAGTNFRAWALAVARWEVRSHITRRDRRGWLVVNDELANRLADRLCESEPLEEGHEMSLLRECIQKLGEKERRLIDAFYGAEASVAECARLLGRSAGGVKVSLFRIRAALRKCIDRKRLATKGGPA